MPASLSTIARHFLFVRETEGQNKGYWVSYFLRFTNNTEGESWCASFLSKIEDIAYKGKSPSVKSASTIVKLNQAKVNGWVVTDPQIDDEFFYIHPDGTAYHTGIVSGINPLIGIAGNTSPDGTSSNGIGVFEHSITDNPAQIKFVRLPQ